jgi:hypothetical protein
VTDKPLQVWELIAALQKAPQNAAVRYFANGEVGFCDIAHVETGSEAVVGLFGGKPPLLKPPEGFAPKAAERRGA